MAGTFSPSAPAAEALRRRYLKVDTATVADVLDAMGHPDYGLAPEFTPYPASAGKMAGWAYTICGEMRPYAGGGDPDKMKAVDGLRPGEISVWGGEGEGGAGCGDCGNESAKNFNKCETSRTIICGE